MKSPDLPPAAAMLLDLAREAIEAVDPEPLVSRSLSLEEGRLVIQGKAVSLQGVRKIHVLGAGKGAVFLYRGLARILGRRIAGGVIVSIPGNTPAASEGGVTFCAGSHPGPDEKSLEAGCRVMDYVRSRVRSGDLVIFLMTGGASALMVQPVKGISFTDIQKVTKCLLASGAEITEINALRKHLSAIKGGRLAEQIAPARVVTLILSDIIDSPLEDIGSGPTVGDSSTFQRVLEIVRRHGLERKLPPSVMEYFRRGNRGEVPDTPVPGAAAFRGNRHFLLGDNRRALDRVVAVARQQGIRAVKLTAGDRGEASEAAKMYAAILDEMAAHQSPFAPPVLLVSGGELTVTLKGDGKGGRNQEFVMHMLHELRNREYPFCILSLGSDGLDGPTDAAGAWIDHRNNPRLRKENIPLAICREQNDSYRLFTVLNQLVKTGPTRTNVMDLRFFYLPAGPV